MADWTLVIEGREYNPIPDSWIEHGLDEDGTGPQLLAVSASVNRGVVRVRYAHPTGTKVGEVRYPEHQSDTGSIPRYLINEAWPRSIAAGRLEPVGDVRLEERSHLRELWDHRLEEVFDDVPNVQLDDERLVADGGRTFECALCGAEYRGRGAALGCCSDRLGAKLEAEKGGSR